MKEEDNVVTTSFIQKLRFGVEGGVHAAQFMNARCIMPNIKSFCVFECQ